MSEPCGTKERQNTYQIDAEVFLRACLASKSSKMAALRRPVQFSWAWLSPFTRVSLSKKGRKDVKKTRVAKSAGVSSSQASRDSRILDHGESADAGFVADGESRVPATAL